MGDLSKKLMGKLCVPLMITLTIGGFTSIIYAFFDFDIIIFFSILIGVLVISIIVWNYIEEITAWNKKRRNTRAERIGEKLQLKTKITIGQAERYYPFPGLIGPEWSYISVKHIEIYCEGAGSRDDPFIIDGVFPLPRRAIFYNNNKHFSLKNLKIKKLGIEKCENFTIENCRFKEFRLEDCSNIRIEDSQVKREIRAKDCFNVEFKSCSIKRMRLFKFKDGAFRKCTIHHLKDWMSKNNEYEDNTITLLESNKKEVNFNNENTLKANRIKETNFKIKRIL